MKKLSIIMLLTAMVSLLLIPKPTAAANAFTDVNKGHAHYDGIHWLSSDDIQGIDGYPDGTFKPANELTRGQAAKIFANVLELDQPELNAAESFTDIETDHEYADEIAAVANVGIFSGNSAGEFMPTIDLTREQMASTLVEALELDSTGVQEATINLQGVDKSHRKSVQILADLEITNKLDDFNPTGSVTRGQFATFMYRAIKDQQGNEEGSNEQPKPEQPKPEPDPEPSINVTKKQYHYSFQSMVNKQMNVRPQTSGAGTWYDASEGVAAHYLNPNNFQQNSDGFYQFLKLSGSSGVSAEKLNQSLLQGKGILAGKGNAFKQGSKRHDVNDVYLISHALLESGNGKSTLATGVEVGQDKNGNAKKVTKKNRKNLTNIKTTYNMYGIGAVDSCPLRCGAERAYKEGWFTPEKSIIGGAKFIGQKYINAGQDTLYKMRWNPDAPASHQYATDAGWAVKQTHRIKEMYKDLDDYVLNFEVPVYKQQPKSSKLPSGVARFNVDTKHAHVGKTASVTASSLNMREGPTTKFKVISKLSKDTKVTIVGKNKHWYKVNVNKKEGWVSGIYLNIAGTKTKVQSIEPQPKTDEEISPDIIVQPHEISLP